VRQVWAGVLQKMRVEASSPVSYGLVDARPGAPEGGFAVNPLIGRRVDLRFGGQYVCTACGRSPARVYDNGYCEDCVRTRADADICMMRPERCHFGDPDNPCRDEAFGLERCFQPHYLYASLTSDVKVGITRKANLPARWIDQGATAAITLALLPSRKAVGEVEHALAETFKDRTHWMNMLRGAADPSLLDAALGPIDARLAELGTPCVLPPTQRLRMAFTYPLDARIERVKSVHLYRAPRIEGVLLGIKGQYLIFDTCVLNVRRHSGFHIELYAEGSP